MNKYVVATGNPFDGLVLYGPFSDAEEANAWAEGYCKNDEWNVVRVEVVVSRWTS